MKKSFKIRTNLLTMLLIASICLPTGLKVNAAKITKPGKISAMLDIILTKENGQEAFVKQYKKQTGITLDINQPSHNQYNEKMLISFASGSIPDVVEIQPDHIEAYVQLAKEGAIIPLDKFISKSKVFKRIDKRYVNSLKINGHIYGTPLNQGGGCVTYIRKDWLDSLGLKAPTTWAELYEVAKAFTFKDPDKNGKNDTIGFTLPGFSQYIYMGDFYQGANHDFIYKNGRWVDGFTQPNFKKALTRLRQAYKEKILDQEVFTNQTSTCREQFYAGRVGIFSYWAGGWAENLDRNVKLHNPKGVVIPLNPMKETHYYNRIAPIVAITSKAKNPEAVFKYFNEYMHDGGEGEMLFVHGVEGVHWTKKGGRYALLPSLVDPKNPAGKAYVHPELAIGPWKDPLPLDPRWTASLQAQRVRMDQVKLQPSSQTFAKYGADINTLKTEIIAKVVMGQYSVDEGLKIYKEKSAKYNVKQVVKEFNANK